jgi:streptomycin 6-kinase
MVSTIFRDADEALQRMSRVWCCFQDERYILMAFRSRGEGYVFLHDADQRALFLGRKTQPIDLTVFWQKRQEDETYCIVCELMLHFDERWIAVPGEPPVELGIDTGTAQRVLEALRGEMPSLEYIDIED